MSPAPRESSNPAEASIEDDTNGRSGLSEVKFEKPILGRED